MVAEATRLIGREDALRLVLADGAPLGTEEVPLAGLVGRVLAAPILSRVDLPIFDNSAVDGYAVCGESDSYSIVGEMRAGMLSTLNLAPGQAARIFTGAPVPIGTTAIVMQEDAMASAGRVRFPVPPSPGAHIRRQGEELRAGDVVLEPMRLNPAAIASIAACGHEVATVYRRPRAGILVTGDELVPAGTMLQSGQIYESNAVGLVAALAALGISEAKVLRSQDNLEGVKEALSQLISSCDVILTSGGASVGDHDVVRPALASLGVVEVFWGVAIKPGKPLFFGRTGSAAVFGLPGNPVSAMVTYHLFVRPYLLALQGLAPEPPIRSRLAADLKKAKGREEFVPCEMIRDEAVPFVGRASHKSSVLARANGLVVLASDVEEASAGDTLDVIPLLWGLP